MVLGNGHVVVEEVKNIWFLEEESVGKREKERRKAVEAAQWISVREEMVVLGARED